MEVLHHHAHEHVQHEKAHQQQERDEVQQPPLRIVLAGLAGEGIMLSPTYVNINQYCDCVISHPYRPHLLHLLHHLWNLGCTGEV